MSPNQETPLDPNVGKEYWEWAPDKPLDNAARITPRVTPPPPPDDDPPPPPLPDPGVPHVGG